MPSDFGPQLGDEGGDVVLLQHHLGMGAERLERHLGVVLRADGQHDAAAGELLERDLEVDIGLAGGAAAEGDAGKPVVADHPAPEGVVEVEHQAAPRQAEPGREHRRGVAGEQRQRIGRVGHLRHVPAAVVEPVARPEPPGEGGDVEEADVALRGEVGEAAVDVLGHAAPRAVEPGGEVAERVGARGGEAVLDDDRRSRARAPPPRPRTSAAISASASACGVSVNGLTASAWWSGARISASSPPA